MTTASILTLVGVFVLGTLFGSFTNVVIYRLPRHQSLVLPGSRCPHCGKPIRPWDNIPIVSFLFLKGRCRWCGHQIAWRYPLVELAAGLLLVLVWIHVTSAYRFDGPGIVLREFAGTAVFALMLLAILFIDLEHRIVPNAISYPGIVLGLLLAIPQGRLLEVGLSALGAGGFFFLVALLSRGGMGGGDVKLAAMMGAFLGWPAIVVALMLAFFLGAGAGLLLIVFRRGTRKTPIPFGPALAAGAIVALLAGDPILQWYLSLGR